MGKPGLPTRMNLTGEGGMVLITPWNKTTQEEKEKAFYLELDRLLLTIKPHCSSKAIGRGIANKREKGFVRRRECTSWVLRKRPKKKCSTDLLWPGVCHTP